MRRASVTYFVCDVLPSIDVSHSLLNMSQGIICYVQIQDSSTCDHVVSKDERVGRPPYPKNTLIRSQHIWPTVNSSRASMVKVVRNPGKQ